ncbi:MAG TPA: beta-ketoacyl-ACP synthase 3 [Solirubrobacteraceae bacterium]|nr:beta-ketoacyl-ACP synthase 3 [Solirubrobacteraceae bacterium]
MTAIAPTGASTRAAAAPTSVRDAIRHATILSVASELPAGRLTSAELAERFGIEEDWIISRTGIRERRRAAPDERLTDYAIRVGAAALDRAGVQARDLDLVVVATMTQDELTPNTAPLVAHALGAEHAGAFDVGAACTAFLTGLSVSAAQIESGRARRVLLIGADFITRITNYEDRKSAPLFADGAGAVVLGEARDGGAAIGPIVLGSDGSHGDSILASHEDRKLVMDGHEVFKHAIGRMSQVTVQAVAQAGLELSDIDLFVYHQANARITRSLSERLGLPMDRVVDCIEMLGNSSAATLPLALGVAERDGRLKPGARVLLSAFGAGFTWGGGVIVWGGQSA